VVQQALYNVSSFVTEKITLSQIHNIRFYKSQLILQLPHHSAENDQKKIIYVNVMGEISALQKRLHTEMYVHVSVGKAHCKVCEFKKNKSKYVNFNFKTGRKYYDIQ
jgi:hypothetical protein